MFITMPIVPRGLLIEGSVNTRFLKKLLLYKNPKSVPANEKYFFFFGCVLLVISVGRWVKHSQANCSNLVQKSTLSALMA